MRIRKYLEARKRLVDALALVEQGARQRKSLLSPLQIDLY
jgi:hypothetical protein